MHYKLLFQCFLILLAILPSIICGAEIVYGIGNENKSAIAGKISRKSTNNFATPISKNFTDSDKLKSTKNGIAKLLNASNSKEAEKEMNLINLIGGNGTNGDEQLIGPNMNETELELNGRPKGQKVGTPPLAKALLAENESEEEKDQQQESDELMKSNELGKDEQKVEEKNVNEIETEKIVPTKQPINQIQAPSAEQAKDKNDNEMREFISSSEESHVFRYFVLLFVILAILYLVAHNRNKIMGYILEGKNARRCGSTARYRRLSQNAGGSDDKEQSQMSGEKA